MTGHQNKTQYRSGAGLAQLDLRLSKLSQRAASLQRLSNQNKKESASLGVIDAFNALNHTNPTISSEQSSPFFGRANSALPGRTIQLSLKYKF